MIDKYRAHFLEAAHLEETSETNLGGGGIHGGVRKGMHIMPASRVLLANGHFKRVPTRQSLAKPECAWRIQKPFDLENDSPSTINREIWGIPEITTKVIPSEREKGRNPSAFPSNKRALYILLMSNRHRRGDTPNAITVLYPQADLMSPCAVTLSESGRLSSPELVDSCVT
ncbi:hypothetical protein CDAR_454651 [Caerostris darwini]|uniref:Uncharacterized protein n=1 Tax=Caerostris darwini TaxID=1538125 RepID=A0AAV4TX01_9ARAC|nr:hypothetical protein CDAR_454651 [Caerostris darwini]